MLAAKVYKNVDNTKKARKDLANTDILVNFAAVLRQGSRPLMETFEFKTIRHYENFTH